MVIKALCNMENLKLGDKLYRYVNFGGMFEYKVIELHERLNLPKQATVRCESCSHGWHCEILIAEDSYGNLIYVSTLKEDIQDCQKHWHTQKDADYYFVKSKEEALIEVKKRNIKILKEDIQGKKEVIKQLETQVKENEDELKALKGMLKI